VGPLGPEPRMDNESRHTKKLSGFQEVKVSVIRCVLFSALDLMKLKRLLLY